MDLYGTIVMAIFSILAVTGIIGIYLSSEVVRILLRHRQDNAPLASFLLNPDASRREIEWMLLPAVTILLTGVFTLAQKLLGPLTSKNPLVELTYLLAYVFGIASAILIVYIVYRWHKKLARYA